MSRIFVCHARSDIEATSEIVDLLETALELPAGAIASSSLPGYAPDTRTEGELREMLSSSRVVLALVTPHGASDTTFHFELGAAWALGVTVIPIWSGATENSELPWPLRACRGVRPHDRGAWQALVQDLASLLGVRVASAAPAPLALCSMALEAGRAISDCRQLAPRAHDLAQELDEPFGPVVDALGGDWKTLRKLQDVDVFMGAMDNLLHGLPAPLRHVAQFYELGFELAALHNLAGQQPAATPAQRASDDAEFQAALDRLLAHAEAAHIRYEDLGPLVGWLENLGGPHARRDFTNVARTLQELRRQAEQADRLRSAA